MLIVLDYLVENLVENLINIVLWFVVAWLFFRPAKVAAVIVSLLPLASYFGQAVGGGTTTEH